MRRLELSGQTFGKWFVLYEERFPSGVLGWLCQCECGLTKVLLGSVLKAGKNTQCATCRKQASLNPEGRWLNKQGYVVMHSYGHPNGYKNGQMYEHGFIMSGLLGRPLHPGETVHHKNGVKNDNDPDNLELWVTHQPKGQRPEDLVEWATEIMARYAT